MKIGLFYSLPFDRMSAVRVPLLALNFWTFFGLFAKTILRLEDRMKKDSRECIERSEDMV